MTARFEICRDIARRIVIDGTLELASPCHIGGADADATSDRPLLRNASGWPYLPGTTLTGLLRAQVTESEGAALFGEDNPEKDARQARLLVSDALLLESASPPTELRDGVAIDPASGVAKDKKKYDLELLPVGTRFALRLELLMPKGGSKEQLRSTAQLLHQLEAHCVQLGARTSRGFGETSVIADAGGSRWRTTEYEVGTREGMKAWLGRRVRGLSDSWPKPTITSHATAEALATHWGVTRTAPKDADSTLRVDLDLEVEGSLLIRSGGHDPGEADHIHLRRMRLEQGGGVSFEPVLPGTSLAGLLRHRCLRIAQTLSDMDRDRACRLVEGMFGPGDIGREKTPWASRVRVSEAVIAKGKMLRHTRVRIDPWTGGAAESLLFSEDAQYEGRVTGLVVSLHAGSSDSPGAERALLLLALRDLALGDLPVGGESGVGRGRLRPPADRPWARLSGVRTATLSIREKEVVTTPKDVLRDDFAALHSFLATGIKP